MPADAGSAGVRVGRGTLKAWFAVIVLIAVGWIMFLTPTDLGSELATAVRAVRFFVAKPGNIPAYSRINFEPVRDTYGSIAGHELAALYDTLMRTRDSRDDSVLSSSLMQGHSENAIYAVSKGYSGRQKSCEVRISAQALDTPDSPYVPMVRIFGGRQDSFTLILMHEIAHCNWNLALQLEKLSGEAGAVGDALSMQMPLIWNLNEGYADASALVLAYRTDRTLYVRSLEALTAVRSQKTPGAIHNTTGALSAVAAMVPFLPADKDPLSTRWEVGHRIALSAALTGSLQWLEQKGQPTQAAEAELRALVAPIGVQFDRKTIEAKSYLIVSSTHYGEIEK